MNREQERIRKNLEKNPVAECNKIQKKYYPMLFEKFAGVKDPRHQSYIEYPAKTTLGTLYYKCLGGIESMREMTRKFIFIFGRKKKEVSKTTDSNNGRLIVCESKSNTNL